MTMRRPTLSSICLIARFQAVYATPGEGDTITKEDLFYYIYGLLHSPDYRSRYYDNLSKELPRIPAVKRFADSKPSAKLAATSPTGTSTTNPCPATKASHYRVEKMKFAKTRDPETNKSINDKTAVYYNDHITIHNIPREAFEYVVNGKPALEWVMERQSVSKDNVQRHRERRQPLGHRNDE